MAAVVFLSIRVFHVLLASTWIGSTIFVSTLLMPAIEASGPSGGQVMMRINRHGIVAYMAALGGTTVLTGLYLFWHFTGAFRSIGQREPCWPCIWNWRDCRYSRRHHRRERRRPRCQHDREPQGAGGWYG